MKVKDCKPPPHNSYLVKRGGNYYTATPCYGTHEPWWVAKLMNHNWPNEADPVPMEDDDEWFALNMISIQRELEI